MCGLNFSSLPPMIRGVDNINMIANYVSSIIKKSMSDYINFNAEPDSVIRLDYKEKDNEITLSLTLNDWVICRKSSNIMLSKEETLLDLHFKMAHQLIHGGINSTVSFIKQWEKENEGVKWNDYLTNL